MLFPLLKIITFNVYLLCVGPACLLREVPDIESRKAQIAAWLKEQNADIVFLQEVWQADQFDYLKKESGYPFGVHFGPTSEMAVLSRHPITGADYIPNRWQGSYAEDCKKGVVGYRYGLGLATVDVGGSATGGGTEIVIANAHPIARRSDVAGFHEPSDALTPERKMLLLEYWLLLKDQTGKKPVIFGGDFNMNHRSDEYDFFVRLFGMTDAIEEKTGDEPFCSYCENNVYTKKQGNPSEHVIDHIFFNRFFEPVSAQIDFPKPDLSDHQPVEATLQIRSTPPTGVPKTDLLSPTPAALTYEIDALTAYFENVSLSSICTLSYELGWKQKQKTLRLLEEMKNSK